MIARDVVNRTITRVVQERVVVYGDQMMKVHALYLDNGTRIYFRAVEHPDGADPFPVAEVVKPRK